MTQEVFFFDFDGDGEMTESGTVELSVVQIIEALFTARGEDATELKAQLKEIGRRDFPQLLTGLAYWHPKFAWTGMVHIIDVIEYLVAINASGVAAEMTTIFHFCGHDQSLEWICLKLCQQIKCIPFGTMLLISRIALNAANKYAYEVQIEALKAFKFGVICLQSEARVALRTSFLAEFETLSKDREDLRKQVNQVIRQLKK